MSNLSIICIILGAVIIIYRTPFGIAPKQTIHLYKYIFSTNTRTRIFGLMGLALWSIAVGISHASENPYAGFIFICGLVAGIFLLLFPIIFTSGFRNWVNNLMDSISMSMETARILSLISAVFGVLLIYLGIAVF